MKHPTVEQIKEQFPTAQMHRYTRADGIIGGITYKNNTSDASLMAMDRKKKTEDVGKLYTASGIHARHNNHYIRTVRVGKKDPLYGLMKERGLVTEDDVMRPDSTAVVSFAIEAPESSVTRDVTTGEKICPDTLIPLADLVDFTKVKIL